VPPRGAARLERLQLLGGIALATRQISSRQIAISSRQIAISSRQIGRLPRALRGGGARAAVERGGGGPPRWRGRARPRRGWNSRHLVRVRVRVRVRDRVRVRVRVRARVRVRVRRNSRHLGAHQLSEDLW